jgi:hypothetical protein
MRISIEGPSDLDNDLKIQLLIVGKVKNYEKFRFNLYLLFFLKVFCFSFEVFFHIVLVTEEV